MGYTFFELFKYKGLGKFYSKSSDMILINRIVTIIDVKHAVHKS